MIDRTKTVVAAGLLLAASFGTAARSASALGYAETGDAGQTLATAQATGTNATTSLTAITGTFNGQADADLFVITITTPSMFSASTVNAVTDASGVDTELFLFNASGQPIAVNDDANGTTTDSSLPTGNALFANLMSGTYYLAVSQSGNEAINSAGQLLFAGYPAGDSTAVRGAASGINPTTEANFNGNAFAGGTGAYEIDLTGAATAVPEPSALAAMISGVLTASICWLRRRRAA